MLKVIEGGKNEIAPQIEDANVALDRAFGVLEEMAWILSSEVFSSWVSSSAAAYTFMDELKCNRKNMPSWEAWVYVDLEDLENKLAWAWILSINKHDAHEILRHMRAYKVKVAESYFYLEGLYLDEDNMNITPYFGNNAIIWCKSGSAELVLFEENSLGF